MDLVPSPCQSRALVSWMLNEAPTRTHRVTIWEQTWQCEGFVTNRHSVLSGNLRYNAFIETLLCHESWWCYIDVNALCYTAVGIKKRFVFQVQMDFLNRQNRHSHSLCFSSFLIFSRYWEDVCLTETSDFCRRLCFLYIYHLVFLFFLPVICPLHRKTKLISSFLLNIYS